MDLHVYRIAIARMLNIFRQNKARTLVVKHGKSPCVCTCTFKANTPLPMLTQQQQQLLLLWPRDHWEQTWGGKKVNEKSVQPEKCTQMRQKYSFCWHFKKETPSEFYSGSIKKKWQLCQRVIQPLLAHLRLKCVFHICFGIGLQIATYTVALMISALPLISRPT